jgi:vacuolar protein sorting-associated protein IST1
MTQQKDTAIAKQTRRQMAQLVEEGKLESARIRVENIIRSDITTELNEILELYCELLLARSQLLDPPLTSPLTNAKGHKEEVHVDPGLEEAVRSIIYAAGQTGVKELHQARALLVEKFGKEFAISAMEGEGVAERVLKKLKVETPSRELVDAYLREICRTYGVRFPGDPTEDEEGEEVEDEEDQDGDDQPGSGGRIAELEDPLEAEELNKAKAPTDFSMSSPLRIAPPSPSTENVTPKLKLPETAKRETKPKPRKTSTDKGSKADGGGPGGKIPNLDDLTARFAALKR